MLLTPRSSSFGSNRVRRNTVSVAASLDPLMQESLNIVDVLSARRDPTHTDGVLFGATRSGTASAHARQQKHLRFIEIALWVLLLYPLRFTFISEFRLKAEWAHRSLPPGRKAYLGGSPALCYSLCSTSVYVTS